MLIIIDEVSNYYINKLKNSEKYFFEKCVEGTLKSILLLSLTNLI